MRISVKESELKSIIKFADRFREKQEQKVLLNQVYGNLNITEPTESIYVAYENFKQSILHLSEKKQEDLTIRYIINTFLHGYGIESSPIIVNELSKGCIVFKTKEYSNNEYLKNIKFNEQVCGKFSLTTSKFMKF